MTTYRILWDHSGTRGHEWTTAHEASRYAAETWGEIEAHTPEDAVATVEREMGDTVDDYHVTGADIHVVIA